MKCPLRKPGTTLTARTVSAPAVSLILILVLFSQSLYAAPPADLPRTIPSRYIVVFHDDVDTDTAANALKARFNIAVGFRYRHALRGMAVEMPEQALDRIGADPRVAYIAPDVVVSINAQSLPTGIDRINAELDPAAMIDGIDDPMDVDIAILDTGIDLDHPDLNVFKHTYCKIQGRNTRCVDGDSGADDGNSHGTHVGGIAAAIDNDTGVVGVAPGARLWAIKVLEDDGNGSGSQILAGVDYVAANADEIEVANMSLTGDGSFQPLNDAISNAVNAGVVFTLAAGNAGKDVSQVFPAGHPDAITVSALEDFDGDPGGLASDSRDDTFAGFSNYGSGIDIMAPGRGIRSTVPGGVLGNKSGTSMAAPHVAGAAALYRLQNPGAGPATVKAALLAAGDTTPCANSTDGTCADDPDGIQEPLLMQFCDSDGDGICDEVDNCLLTANPEQQDADGDGTGDACDPDKDGDGVDNTTDNCPLTPNPGQFDLDADGIGDACDPDMDGDGLTNAEEDSLGTNPADADTDDDGLTDYEEVNTYNTSPLIADTDGDSLNDGDEIQISTDPLSFDTDNDSFSDGIEVANNSDPLDAISFPIFADGDLNGDGIVNVVDVLLATQILHGDLAMTNQFLSHGDVAPLVDGNPSPDGSFNAGDLLIIQRKALSEVAF